jgi:hypothetical protein
MSIVRRTAVATTLLLVAAVPVAHALDLPELPYIPSLPLDPLAPPPTPPPPPSGCSAVTLDMRVLVLSADGTETTLPAIREALDYHSVPHDVWIASQQPGQLVGTALSDGCAGRYQGVVLTTGSLAYTPDGGVTFLSALTVPEWDALRTYEAQFGVREVAWYVYPGADSGLNTPSGGVDTGANPIPATLTAAGQAVFSYVPAGKTITIANAWTYLTTAADPSVTPLLVDAQGNVLVSSRAAGGREAIVMTFDSNQHLLHHVALAHGLVEWVTRGVYLGEYRVYLTPQVDDVYNDNQLYGGGEYRMTATDVLQMKAWQLGVQALQGNQRFKLALAFNASYAGLLDPLSIKILATSGFFNFINHTWTHLQLDTVDYATAFNEMKLNDDFGKARFVNYATSELVTPEISGLNNPAAMLAAKNLGVKYMTSDTSRPGWNNPHPNIGMYSLLEPSILFVPRRPTNLYYNVSTPTQWLAEYNAFYASYWGKNLTYAELLDKESQFLLFYMLRGDLDPQMYHQANLRAYDGSRSLLSDLHDAAIAKLRQYSSLPIESPTMRKVGTKMADTMARDAAGVSAVLTPGTSITLSSPSAVTIVVTGACQVLGSDVYAGKCITPVAVPAGGSVTLEL